MNDNAQADYRFSLFSNLRKFLLSKGFDINVPTYYSENMIMASDLFGILLCEGQGVSRKNLSRFIKWLLPSPPRQFIGILWLHNVPRGADEGNWVFEMDGDRHIDLTRQLVEDMAIKFKVKIKFCLNHDYLKPQFSLST